MSIISRNFLYLVVWVFMTALLTACGNKSTAITSTTVPYVFYVHSLAFNNSSLYAWGANTYGQLGNGDNTGATKLTPMQVLITNAAGASVGGTHTLAFKSDNTAWAWGNNGFGQLGNGTSTISFFPVQVLMTVPAGSTPTPLPNVTAVAAGGNHSLALQSNGTVWAWGDNTYGQLGDTTNIGRLTAVQVQGPATGSPLNQITKIAAGGSHSLAIAGLDANSPVFAWGYNGYGQLGQQRISFTNLSTSTNRPNVLPVTKADGTALSNVTDIAAGGSHSLFLIDGNVWACGYNYLGQLGVGDTNDRHSGVVRILNDANGNDFTGVTAIATGLDHSLARKSDGSVWAWGYNFSGQLGNGALLSTITPVTAPVQVMISQGNSLINVKKIVAIGNSSFAVDANGQLWAWGDNTFGQLGNGTATNSNFAVKVNNLTTNSNLNNP